MKNKKSAKYFAGIFLLLGGAFLCLHNYSVYLYDIGSKTWTNVTPVWLQKLSADGHYFLRECAEVEGGLPVAVLMGLVFLTICIGFFTEKPSLIAAGSAAGTVVRFLISCGLFYSLRDWGWRSPYSYYQEWEAYKYILPMHLCFLLFFVLLLLASTNRKRAKPICGAAAGVIVLRLIAMVVFRSAVFGYHISTGAVVSTLLLASGAFYSGLALAEFAPKKVRENVSEPLKKRNETTDSLDALAKLKQFMDDGMITQEEFEAKKKDLLGLK